MNVRARARSHDRSGGSRFGMKDVSFLQRTRAAFVRIWPWLRWPVWIGCGLALGFLIPYTAVLDARVRDRVGEIAFSQPTRVYARPQPLSAGVAMSAVTLALELSAAGYTHEQGEARVPGTYSRDGGHFVIASRGYADPADGELPRRVRVTLSHGQVDSVKDLTS